MADIISDAQKYPVFRLRQTRDGEQDNAAGPGEDDLYAYAEALFFAYRDFISEPDLILNEIGFGRAHHRVLHFIYRYPGMRVADLLDILKITKQSLARVLRELIDEGYVNQKAGKSDKRERLLYLTEAGEALAIRLAAPQLDRLRKALGQVDAKGRHKVTTFLNAMVSDWGRLEEKHKQDGNEPEKGSGLE